MSKNNQDLQKLKELKKAAQAKKQKQRQSKETKKSFTYNAQQMRNHVWRWMKQHDYKWKWKMIWGTLIFVSLIMIDVVSKQIAYHNLTLGQHPPVKFIPGLIGFSLVFNSGVAFGANSGSLGVTIFIAMLIIVFALVAYIFVNQVCN